MSLNMAFVNAMRQNVKSCPKNPIMASSYRNSSKENGPGSRGENETS